MNLIIKNISNASKEYLEEFYSEIKNLPQKIVELINEKSFKIILADKASDLFNKHTLDELISYKEDYNIETIDKTIRGNCSDNIDNGSINIFYNTTQNIVGAILYHEIGHLVDYHINFENPVYSTSQEFIDAYKKDLNKNWQKIKKDKRYRLIHYIQNSTPENPDEIALRETFAHCFARSFNKIDDIDIVSEYFENCLKVTKKIVKNFIHN